METKAELLAKLRQLEDNEELSKKEQMMQEARSFWQSLDGKKAIYRALRGNPKDGEQQKKDAGQ